MFEHTSRYYNLEITTLTTAGGRVVSYVRRRFLPDPAKVVVLAEHTVSDKDRLDNITARYLDDPEQFWRVADANSAMRPKELTEKVERKLIIPLPQPEAAP